MKSGTTTLFDLLAKHPQIAPCFPKEPGFFAFEDRWSEGFSWYESLFCFDPDQHVYGLDGSTDYSKFPFCNGVVDRLAKSAPRQFKLIYVLRHPLRRIESHAQHVQLARREVGTGVSIRSDHSLDSGISPISYAISKYAEQLDQFHEMFVAGDLLILTLEEMVADQQGSLDRVFSFLEIDSFTVAEAHSNKAGTSKRVPSYWHELSELEPLSTAIKAVIPRSLRHALRAKLSRRVDVQGRFRLTSEEERHVLKTLASDISRLESEYGIDVGGVWGINAIDIEKYNNRK